MASKIIEWIVNSPWLVRPKMDVHIPSNLSQKEINARMDADCVKILSIDKTIVDIISEENEEVLEFWYGEDIGGSNIRTAL